MSGPFGSTAWMANPASGFYDHTIDQSCRFEAGDNPYLSKTYGSAGSSVDVWTVSWWMKLTNGSAKMRVIFGGGGTFRGGGNTATFISLGGSGVIPSVILQQYNSGTTANVMATPLLRDESAWYHCVVRFDSTQSTDTNRVRIYINGVESPAYTRYDGSTVLYPNQNVDSTIGGATEHYIAKAYGEANSDGCFYLADFNYCDGQSLAPSSFGEFKNDIWIAKDTSGLTFGDNGFRMQFETSGTLGNDTSGNNNDYASSGLAATDQVPDSPTNNFATLNPLFRGNNNNRTISEGNLKYQATNDDIFAGNFGMSSGKHYFEIYVNDIEGTNNLFGITQETSTNFNKSVHYRSGSGEIVDALSSAATQTSLSNAANGNIVSISVDLDGGSVQFKLNNSNVGSAVTIPSGTYFAITGNGNSSISGAKIWTFNFGQDSSFAGAATAQGNADGNGIGDFYYAPPSGFLALCTSNLPDPVETVDPNKGGSVQDYFNTVLYTAASSDGTYQITGNGFQPDFSWVKNRNNVERHFLFDSVRGNTSMTDKFLVSNSTAAEGANGVAGTTVTVNADGMQIVETSIGASELYFNSRTYVMWNWKAGTAFSNDASSTSVGTIDSSGSVNTDVGFSIINYVGTAANATIAHGLGVKPKVVIVKNRDQAGDWCVYHEDNGATHYQLLNTTNAKIDNATIWNDIAPTSSTFSIGSYLYGNTINYIAYCFASVDGYSKFGSYTGNGNADGPFVYTGFRPAWVMVKRTDGANSWTMFDSSRIGYNQNNYYVYAQSSNAEATDLPIDILSNGFKIRNTGNDTNASGGTYIYMAFAEQPFKYANAR